MSTVAVRTFEQTSFHKLAADTYISDAPQLARKLALAFTVSTDWSEFFAACRFDRAVSGYVGTPIASLLDGRHFDRVDQTSGADFDDCKESAWLYREEFDF